MNDEHRSDAFATYYSRLIRDRPRREPDDIAAVPGSLITFTPQDLAALTESAIRAVQAMHTPYASGAECAGCARYYQAGRWPWPCPSRRAADDELSRRNANP